MQGLLHYVSLKIIKFYMRREMSPRHEIRSPFLTKIVCPDPVSDQFFFSFSGLASKKLRIEIDEIHSSLLGLERQ